MPMSDKELLDLVRDMNYHMDVFNTLSIVNADDEETLQSLKNRKEEKKKIIMSSLKRVLRDRPELVKECFPEFANK